MPKIVLITGSKGGIGKTTISYNLAANISNSTKVAVLDFDLQGSLSQLKDLVTDFDIIPYEDGINEISNLNYDFIFIDTPPYLINVLPKLMDLADLIILPIKASFLDLLAIRSTINLIERGNNKDKVLVVFNMIKANTTLTLDILIRIKEFDLNIAKTHISDLVAFTRSILANGVSNDKNAQTQIDNLTKEILKMLI